MPIQNDPERVAHYLIVGIIAFLGGIVQNIVIPERRGLLGFISAATIGVFSGGVAGGTALAYEAPLGAVIALTGVAAVVGNNVLIWLLSRTSAKTVNVNVHGGQNNIGETEVAGNQVCGKEHE